MEIPAGSTAGVGFLYPGADFSGLATDLTVGGGSRLRFTLAKDPGNGSLEVDVRNSTGNAHATIPLTGRGLYDLPFDSFIGDSSVFADAEELIAVMTFTAGDLAVSAQLSDIRVIASTQPTHVRLSWDTRSGEVYFLQYSESFIAGTWMPLLGPIAGDGSRFRTEPQPLGEAAPRFYRVLITNGP